MCQSCSLIAAEDCGCICELDPEDATKDNYLRVRDGLPPRRYNEDEEER